MRVVIADAIGPIHWAISRDDPAHVPLHSHSGWSLLNPTAALREICKEPYATSHYFYVNDQLYLDTSQLTLCAPDDAAEEEQIKLLETLLRRLRFVTKQVTFPTELAAIRRREIEEFPATLFPKEGPINGMVRDFLYDTPVTMEAASQAGALPGDFTPPVYDSLLMDAMYALVRHDYRTAILYAAIAVEVLSGILCQSEHQRLFNAVPLSEAVRKVTIVRPGSEVTTMDPVYRYLANSKSFSVLLSELPLYVFRRSMLEEDQHLYQKALRLYRTRNGLAHRPGTDSDRDVFPFSHAGATSALECAVEVFAWFRVEEKYSIPRGEWRHFQRNRTECSEAINGEGA